MILNLSTESRSSMSEALRNQVLEPAGSHAVVTRLLSAPADIEAAAVRLAAIAAQSGCLRAVIGGEGLSDALYKALSKALRAVGVRPLDLFRLELLTEYQDEWR